MFKYKNTKCTRNKKKKNNNNKKNEKWGPMRLYIYI